MFFSRKSATRDSIHSNLDRQRFQSVVAFPVWTQATHWEARRAPFTAKTCRLLSHYFKSGDSNRFWTLMFWKSLPPMSQTRFCRRWINRVGHELKKH